MGYFYLLLQAVIFSFGGLMIKAAGTMFSPFLISCLRFTIGISILLCLQRIRTKGNHLTLVKGLVIIGGICKALHYLAENYGVMRGFSYGGVLVWPVQTIVVFLVSVLVYREKVERRTAAGVFLCVSGIVLLSWNGAPLDAFVKGGLATMVAFVLAGIGAAGFSLSQKRMVQQMDVIEMNASMFIFGWLTTVLALLPSGSHLKGEANAAGIVCMALLGGITCVGFLLQGEALKTVPVLIATIIQSSTVILTILWGVLFYGDQISIYVVIGTILFMAGILVVNVRQRERKRNEMVKN